MSIQLAKRALNAQSLLCRALIETSKIASSRYHEKVARFFFKWNVASK
jgi:hypothetical protein